jgi:formylmethanofuran dehydrogenase subunit B
VAGIYALEGRWDDSEEFYNLLKKILETTPKFDLILVVGYLNGRGGNNKTANCIGKHLQNIYNISGTRFIDFVVYNHLDIVNTWYK